MEELPWTVSSPPLFSFPYCIFIYSPVTGHEYIIVPSKNILFSFLFLSKFSTQVLSLGSWRLFWVSERSPSFTLSFIVSSTYEDEMAFGKEEPKSKEIIHRKVITQSCFDVCSIFPNYFHLRKCKSKRTQFYGIWVRVFCPSKMLSWCANWHWFSPCLAFYFCLKLHN